MTLEYNKIRNWNLPDVQQTYDEKQVILYALAVGYGFGEAGEDELQFVYERGLKAAPTLPVILGYPGFWMKDSDARIDWVKALHVGQRLVLHRPLPVSATIVGLNRVTAVVDKGPGKGALIVQEREVRNATNDDLLATMEQVTLCRGDGGFGKGDNAPAPPPAIPFGPPDFCCELPTISQAALLYRLCGDPNPLHADPAVARSAGYDRPILHGLCTFGVAAHALLRSCCNLEPDRLQEIAVRFSGPVYPGEALRTEIWRSGRSEYAFRTFAVKRAALVLDSGHARVN